MSAGDRIQIIIACIYGVTLLIILLQLRSQRKMLMAQLLKDSFEMYWKTLDPIPEQAVAQLSLYPDDYMGRKLYETKYKGDADAIRKYILMLHVYEYLAFTYYGLKRHGLPDPFVGYDWTKMWTKDLVAEQEFLDVNDYQGRFYPDFASFVDKLRDA